jgi:hypothetical protein
MTKSRMNKNSRELWRGPSLIDGQEIVVLASGFVRESLNTKTGDMLQVYILRADISPLKASQTGDDVSICGECILRPILVQLERKTQH